MPATRTIRRSQKPREGFARRASKYAWMRQASILPPAPGRSSRAPAYPRNAPAIHAGRERGAVVLGELELAWRLIPNEFVAVTGTNGKTTTTEWIGHVYREAGLPVAVAGNVGTAMSSLIGELADDVTVVCEASSFQLEDTVAFSPEAAVLLNLSPDHLDRHGTYEDYVAAKLRIFANQGNYDVAVAAGQPRGRGSRRVRPASDVRRGRRAGAVGPRRLPVVGRAADTARRRDRAAGSAQRSERDGGRRGVPGVRRRRRGSRDRPAHVRGGPPPARADRRRGAASLGSTTQRRPTSRARSSRSRRSQLRST